MAAAAITSIDPHRIPEIMGNWNEPRNECSNRHGKRAKTIISTTTTDRIDIISRAIRKPRNRMAKKEGNGNSLRSGRKTKMTMMNHATPGYGMWSVIFGRAARMGMNVRSNIHRTKERCYGGEGEHHDREYPHNANMDGIVRALIVGFGIRTATKRMGLSVSRHCPLHHNKRVEGVIVRLHIRCHRVTAMNSMMIEVMDRKSTMAVRYGVKEWKE